ncbi:MAG: 16S rRNA (adenine(1518)-N(6)/adenine(1519)-N(6))-dimethyltransferase, partial [Rickettsiaceae bacterium]|nr:16S rRNA (adenine(1518)-N(6)/adenine(1519)-N(6))-dimethyltransferase [Rickettsiaceae bacterium]
IKIISKLPYNDGTELVFRWLDTPNLIDSITLMLQKEVVYRICAKHSTKAYGKLSVMCQNLAEVSKEFDVSPKAFYPPPKVHSSIVTIIPKKPLLDSELITNLRAISHKAFMMRRKMVKKALHPLSEELLLSVGINPSDRPEDLSPADYLALAKRIL